MYVLGLMGRAGTECHDGAAALLRDGDLVAAVEQERLSRNKHAPGEAPNDAAGFCLDAAGIDLADVDHVAYGWRECGPDDGERVGEHVVRSRRHADDVLHPDDWGYDRPPALHYVDHHVTHVMAAVGESGFDEAAALVADGRGESVSITLAEYVDGALRIVDSYPVTHSLGIMFEAASYYAGLGRHGGGKLMGLSSYGSPTHAGWLEFDAATGEFSVPIPDSDDHSTVFDEWVAFFEDECYPYVEGSGESAIYYQDFAASVQQELTSVVLDLLAYLDAETSARNLVFGGGVALNSVLNRRIHVADRFDDLFVHPASNDAGAAVGSAYELCRVLDVDAGTRTGPFDPFTGPAFTDAEVARALDDAGLAHVELSEDALLDRVAAALADDRVVGWFQAETEFGPRALGNRSLLGNPTSRQTLYAMNELKGRAPWRPLAPSVLADRFDDVLAADCSRTAARYMLTTASVSREWRRTVPAVVHVDGTCRPQLVDGSVNPRYHRLLRRFERETGVPLLVNTSFNLSGEPIVTRPTDAISTFRRAERMDALVLGNRYVARGDADGRER